ncbi:glutathione S-transferase family protein [Roseibium sp. Sym1]|uniref:glutathione S-transferase family protein n=1 Tax=Roseibium sp. Sym1 TaxID=3016006 RepID=UPI0022B3D830|nr:glutathione S-transferase family protein [Roseibium sp. Sym1]
MNMNAPYTLFWERLSGAIAPHVMLEELGVDHRLVHVDMAAGDHRRETYRSINPVMRIPALRLPDGTVIGETSAIMLVLSEAHAGSGLVPGLDDPDRPAFLFWLTSMAANGYPIFSRAWHPEQFTTDDQANESVRQRAESHLAEFFSVINGAIEGNPYFLPSGYTALDIYLTMLTEWSADRQALFAANPRIAALCGAVMKRPAYRKVIGMHAAPVAA